jgi:cyclophilin family peptidyl-prolyl cis-trans isomerase/HEAT repeat protein
MRTLAAVGVFLLVSCATLPPQPSTNTGASEAYGLTVAEEARVLGLEDRREYDPAFILEWSAHPNPLHRLRLAMALAHIGPHVAEGTAARDLAHLATDPDRRVREAVAFGLGEIADLDGIEALFNLTHDSDLGVAAEAAEALSKYGTNPVFLDMHFAHYQWMLDDQWPEGVHARAVRYLFRFNTPAAMDAAMRALSSSSAVVRQEAAYALSRKAHASARAQLELLLTDPNTLTRAYAVNALGRIADAASAPPLVNALGDMHPWVRTNAAVALSRIAEKDRAVLRVDDLPRIFAALEDPDPGVRASMVDLVGYYAEKNETAFSKLVDLVNNGSQWQRELAAGAFGKHFEPSSGAHRYLPGSTFTPWQMVRLIEGTASTAAGPSTRAQYAANESPMVRAAVLGAIPDEAAWAELSIIQKGLTDPDVVVRANAYDRYAHVTTEPLETRLQTLQDAEKRERSTEANDGRLAALSAIASMKDPTLRTYLTGFLEDADPVVRRVVSDLLYEIDHRRRPYTPFVLTTRTQQYEEIVKWARRPHTATIHMPRGNIELVLLTQDAPMTTWNFAQLAKKGYFNNTSFMRVVPNFVIQGGDPRNDMNGGPGYAIRDEINLQKYTRGAVGMALSGPDTGGSQFFITHSPQPHLDGGYTIFARVYDGMTSVVDQVERGDRVDSIAIDERPAPAQGSGVANVSLPLKVGPITAGELLESVPEYQQRKSDYTPDETVLEMMTSYMQPGDRIEVFMGTWCSDSQREVPKLLRIVDDLHTRFHTELPVKFFALDRSKQNPASLTAGKDVEKVATFIYYRGDQELGRIVEKPVAVFEDDLLAIVGKPAANP